MPMLPPPLISVPEEIIYIDSFIFFPSKRKSERLHCCVLVAYMKHLHVYHVELFVLTVQLYVS